MNNEEYFMQLYKAYIAELLRYAGRWVDKHLAEDLVDETYLAAWASIESLRSHPAPRKWLYKTLYHKCSHEVERKSYQLEIPTEFSQIEDIPAMEERRIADILPEGLTKAETELILMRYEKEMDFIDIAETLGIKETAARRRVTRAIAKCRMLLLAESEYEKN